MKLHKVNIPNEGTIYTTNKKKAEHFINAIFNKEEYLQFGISLEKNSVVIDAGANIGLFTIFAFNKCFKQIKIYSIEPIPNTFKILKKNIESNNLEGKAILINKGLTSIGGPQIAEFTSYLRKPEVSTMKPEDKEISNFKPLRNPKNFLTYYKQINKSIYWTGKIIFFIRPFLISRIEKFTNKNKKIVCKLTNISKIIDDYEIKKVDLLKIDVEGAEFDVIQGAKNSHWPMIKQVVAEVHDINTRINDVTDFLKKRGFNTIKVHQEEFYKQIGWNHHTIYALR